eukprot:GHUV01045192.1.p1 GENE.GHUV01045192.1~~GHUV01045192.1.p1  ORF type:complete len:154 (+),score=7.93 GHUV01045192.1:94-555(+)
MLPRCRAQEFRQRRRFSQASGRCQVGLIPTCKEMQLIASTLTSFNAGSPAAVRCYGGRSGVMGGPAQTCTQCIHALSLRTPCQTIRNLLSPLLMYFIAVHAGAGYHGRERKAAAYTAAMRQALKAAADYLDQGRDCVAAVKAAICILEVLYAG